MKIIEKPFEYSSGYIVAVFIVVLLGLALRVSGLTESLWYDEMWSTRIRLQSISQLIWVALLDVHPPGYEILSFVWVRLFGDSELSVRTIPLISGLGGIVLTCEIARRYVSPRAGVLAGVLVALSPTHIWYSHEARSYALISLLVLLAVWARSFFVQGDYRSRWLVLYAVSLLAALSLHYYVIAFAGAFMVIDLLARDPARQRLLLINVLGCAAVFGYIGLKYALGHLELTVNHVRAFDTLALWMTIFGWFPSGHALFPVQSSKLDWSLLANPLMLGSHLLLLGLLVCGMLAGWKRCRASSQWVDFFEWLAPFFCVPLLLYALKFLGFESFIERSLFVALPFFFILVACGLDSIRPILVRVSITLALFVFVGSGLCAFIQKDNEWTVYKQNPDWSSASEYILNQSGDDPSVVFVSSPPDVLLYYGDAFRLNMLWEEPIVPRQREIPVYYFGEVDAWQEQNTENLQASVFLVNNLYWPVNYKEQSTEFLSNHEAVLLDRFETKGLQVEKYRFKYPAGAVLPQVPE